QPEDASAGRESGRRIGRRIARIAVRGAGKRGDSGTIPRPARGEGTWRKSLALLGWRPASGRRPAAFVKRGLRVRLSSVALTLSGLATRHVPLVIDRPGPAAARAPASGPRGPGPSESAAGDS